MKITLKDIAEQTGYSISTVSRVLNGSKKISKPTRREIYHTAKRLKYPLYQTLNGDAIVDDLKVCIIVTGFHVGEFYSSMFQGMNHAAQSQNVQLSMISLEQSFDHLLTKIENLIKDNYEGLLLFAPELTREDYISLQEILPSNFPIISNALIENPVISTVTFDGYSGGFLAGEHFKKQGYRRCGIIKGPFGKAEARYRFNGFRDFLLQQSQMDLCWQYQGDFSFESGKKAFSALEDADAQPQAIFACNDEMGHAFLEEALTHGYDVPQDLALIGFDDLPICSRHRPTITSIHTDYKKLGIVTFEKMKEMISNPDQQEGILSLVPVSLEVRKSS